MTTDDWERRIDEVWDLAAGSLVDDEVIARIDAIAAERGDDDARAVFERAGARDSAGRPDEAVPLYRRALELGLDAEYRPQAVVQLASSIRNLGDAGEALRLIEAEHRDHPEGHLLAVPEVVGLVQGGEPVVDRVGGGEAPRTRSRGPRAACWPPRRARAPASPPCTPPPAARPHRRGAACRSRAARA